MSHANELSSLCSTCSINIVIRSYIAHTVIVFTIVKVICFLEDVLYLGYEKISSQYIPIGFSYEATLLIPLSVPYHAERLLRLKTLANFACLRCSMTVFWTVIGYRKAAAF